MKRPENFRYLLLILVLCCMTACSSNISAIGRLNCSRKGEICITLHTVQSFKKENPIQLKIIVTSSEEISDLHLTLHTGAEITIDGPSTWEKDLSNPSVWPGYASWNFSIKEGQSLTFTRVLHFPMKQGYFHISAEVANLGRIINAIDSFPVVLSEAGGQVILPGTPLPLLTPKGTSAVYGPGTPVPTLITNPTYRPGTVIAVPSLVRNLTPTQIVPLAATSTPQQPPYPPPPTPTPTPTPTIHIYP